MQSGSWEPLVEPLVPCPPCARCGRRQVVAAGVRELADPISGYEAFAGAGRAASRRKRASPALGIGSRGTSGAHWPLAHTQSGQRGSLTSVR